MSYILDALQRREAQENPETAVALAMKRHHDRRIRVVGTLVAVALIANAAVLLWVFLPDREPAQAPPAQATAPAAS